MRDALFRLRYQVYCLENTFENPAQFPDGRETDEYDAHSLHAALIYKPLRTVVGGVRLIQARGAGVLPLYSIVGRSEANTLRQLSPRIAEISRYAVAGSFRRRQGEADYPDLALHSWSSEAECRRVLPHITLGLMRAILGYCAEQDIRLLCATMAPALLRLLDRLGLHFRPIGPLVTFHGVRQPCFAWYQDLLAGLRTRHMEFHDVVIRGFDPAWTWNTPDAPRPHPVPSPRPAAAGLFNSAISAPPAPAQEQASA
jgi:N-acyl amino acid synthase of PEP-CTERM/exosortase system